MQSNGLLLIASVALVSACASAGMPPKSSELAQPVEPVYEEITNPYFEQIAQSTDKTAKDRLAILAMRGNYRVGFQFQETVPLKAGYELHDDKTTGGFETVLVINDRPDHIALQHILVAPNGQVIKHWRQDWSFEASHRFEFVEEQNWEVRSIRPEVARGTWTQCVFEVSDAPRYCGTGKWNHKYGVSTWTSDRSWRPLPRREYTKRNDYNALNAENRHTVTPHGWTHEQDNTKTIREGAKTVATLVREFGFNDYRSITGYDFTPAQDYWRKTSDYWSLVRSEWARRLQAGASLRIDTEVDGMPIIEATFAQADAASETTEQEEMRLIAELLGQWTRLEKNQQKEKDKAAAL